jgi:uncharacterized membrane protein
LDKIFAGGMCVDFERKGILFAIGGLGYYLLEILWRGWSHWTMFVLGGGCFLLIGGLEERAPKLPLWEKLLAGSAICTAGELLFGLLFNRDHRIWDYRQLPFQYRGQISLLFSLLWMPLALAGMLLYRGAETVIRAYFLPSAAK